MSVKYYTALYWLCQPVVFYMIKHIRPRVKYSEFRPPYQSKKIIKKNVDNFGTEFSLLTSENFPVVVCMVQFSSVDSFMLSEELKRGVTRLG